MLKRLSFVGFVAVLLGIASCETDFSLNGKYELTPIVFGLIDHDDSIHVIKITKAFLGDGDNLVYAQNPDSNYFEQVDARVIEINTDGDETGREWTLTDSIVAGKSTDGVFYAPDQKVYYFEEKTLNSAYTYKIIGDLNEGQKSFSAETNLIDQFSVSSTIQASTFKVRFAKNTVNETNDYLAWNIDFNAGENAGKYEVSYTFHWTEFYNDGTSKSFSATKLDVEESDENKSARISGLTFFQWIQTTIPDDENIDYRTADGLDLQIAVAHEDLEQFIEVGNPVTGIAQVQPVYTNVEGGFGLFSARHIFTIEDMNFDASTVKELSRGQYTITKLFCSSFAVHIGESFHCE